MTPLETQVLETLRRVGGHVAPGELAYQLRRGRDVTPPPPKDRTMTRAELEARALQVVADLSVRSEAPAASLEGKTSSSKPGSKPPPWPGESAHDYHRRSIRRAWWSDARLAVAVEDAEAELHAIRFSRRRADGATHEGKLEIATCPGDARKVARVYGVSVRHVYSMREWARRHGIEA